MSPEGRKQTDAQVSFYLENARIINDGLKSLGITTYGGGNAPYVWLKTPGGISSWDFLINYLTNAMSWEHQGLVLVHLEKVSFRLSAFGHRENVEKAVSSIKERLKI